MQEPEESPQEENQGIPGFPPEVYEKQRQLYRDVKVPGPDGSTRMQVRPVARTQIEARVKRQDFWHSEELGWIRAGYKWERDRSIESIMADGSSGIPMSVDRQEQIRQEALSG